MVDEKEEHYEEEGEYHFSDDQVNYDIEPEAPKAKTSSGLNKETILAAFTQNRRRLLGVLSLLILIGVVYKILVPSSSTPQTEFNQTKATTPVTTVTTAKTTTTTTQAVTTPVAPTPVVATQTPSVVTTSPVTASTQLNQSASQPPMTAMPSSAPANLPPNLVQTSPTTAVSMPQTSTMPSSPVTTTMVSSTQGVDGQTKDRITALEQQNTAMMNLLQTEFAQKIADNETQSTVVRGKMEELTKRVNRMEASLNQITQLLQGMNKSQAGMMSGAPAAMYNTSARAGEPRMIYSVQAIIPGRAWLKSETGDTVTVAEGDYLKKYGRVTKIDPYDGIVSIDTGNKVVSLSYGLDGE